MDNEAYNKIKDLFGEELTNSMFPELGIGQALINISAILQTICNILILKGIITKEEYLKWFSEEELTKMEKYLEEEAKKENNNEDQ